MGNTRTAAKKVTAKRAPGLRAPATIVASLPSTTTNRAWIYAASTAGRLAEWRQGSAGKWCVFRHSDAIDRAWITVRSGGEGGIRNSLRLEANRSLQRETVGVNRLGRANCPANCPASRSGRWTQWRH